MKSAKDRLTLTAGAKVVKGSRELLIMRRVDPGEPGGRYAADLAEKEARHRATLPAGDEDLNRVPGLRAREPRCKVPGRVLGRDEALATAHGLMQDFYRRGDPEWSRRKRQGLHERCNKAANSGVPEMRAAAFTLKRHAKGILAGYRHGKTNAAAKDADNTIKVPRRKSYNFSLRRQRVRPVFSIPIETLKLLSGLRARCTQINKLYILGHVG